MSLLSFYQTADHKPYQQTEKQKQQNRPNLNWLKLWEERFFVFVSCFTRKRKLGNQKLFSAVKAAMGKFRRLAKLILYNQYERWLLSALYPLASLLLNESASIMRGEAPALGLWKLFVWPQTIVLANIIPYLCSRVHRDWFHCKLTEPTM